MKNVVDISRRPGYTTTGGVGGRIRPAGNTVFRNAQMSAARFLRVVM